MTDRHTHDRPDDHGCDHGESPAAAGHTHRLVVSHLTAGYRGIRALDDISFELRCGTSVGILGPNGAGKTTLLRALIGLIPLESGHVQFLGHQHDPALRALAYLPQRGEVDWDFPITVRQLVEMGRYCALGEWKPFTKDDETIVEHAMELTGLQRLAERQIRALSGGQQQRAFLARALAQQAHVYLLDEPFSGLDPNAQQDLRRLLRTMARDGKLVMVTHHDLETVQEIFDEVLLLNRRLLACGPPVDVMTPQLMRQTFGRHGRENHYV